MKPAGYHEQKACANCKHAFGLLCHDGTTQLFCDVEYRNVKDGSVIPVDPGSYVQPHGLCAEHEPKQWTTK